MTGDVYALAPGESQPTWLLEPDGRLMSSGVVRRPGEETTRLQLLLPKSAESRVAHWLRALSDGFVEMDQADVFAKAPGPVVVRRLPHELASEWQQRPPAVAAFDDETIGWAFHKPYWIGQRARAQAPGKLAAMPEFEWKEPEDTPLKRTHLNEVHRAAGAKMVPFAGWEMPVQYTSVQQEHLDVRRAAGLFDVSHMGLFEFSGDNVHLFLNTIASNDVSLLAVGGSQYAFLLAPNGHVIDDTWIYRLGKDCYWMVVNAANTGKDWAWIDAVRNGCVMIDRPRPWSRALGTEGVVMRNLNDPAAGADMRGQLALQGPRSREILLAMARAGATLDDRLIERLNEMQHADIIHADLAGYDLHISRTGYTGEPMAFEIFAHPDALPALWDDLLAAGEPFGLRPIGLAARDSLRIEAGLPLYGHELAGPLDLNPSDAGFPSYVKLYKPFFIGKAAYIAYETKRQGRLARFRLDEEHAPVPGLGDVIVNHRGRVVGTVTSCSLDSEGRLTGLGWVEEPNNQRDTHLGIYRLGNKNWEQRPLSELKPGDRLQLPDAITVIERFLNKK